MNLQDRTYCNWGTIPGSADPGVIGVIGVAGPIVWWMFTLPIFSVRSVIGAIGDMRLCCWIQINVEIVSHLNRPPLELVLTGVCGCIMLCGVKLGL